MLVGTKLVELRARAGDSTMLADHFGHGSFEVDRFPTA
jgi:hypothetical protein